MYFKCHISNLQNRLLKNKNMLSAKKKGKMESREEKENENREKEGGGGGEEAERKGDLLYSEYANYRIKKNEM